MAKQKYIRAKQIVKELYGIIPTINPRLALRVLEQSSELPANEIPKDYTTIRKWFKEFGDITETERREQLIRYIDGFTPIKGLGRPIKDKE